MTATAAGVLRAVAIAAGLLAWAVLAHLSSTGAGGGDAAVALAVSPLVAGAGLLLWRIGGRLRLAGGVVTLATVAVLWPMLRANVALLYLIQHIGTNLALAAVFGRSLFGGGEALVTQFARTVHGTLSLRKVRYTRGVTQVWTLFFLSVAGLSLGLYAFAPAPVWSVFANLLTLPLLGAMFLGEYCVRRCVLPPEDQTGLRQAIGAYRETMRRRSLPTIADPS